MRTPSSCGTGVGIPCVGGLRVGVISWIVGLGGLARRFFFVSGLGGGEVAGVLDVRGFIFRAVGSIYAGDLAIFHPVRLDKMLRKEKVRKEVKCKQKAICRRK